MRLKKVAKIFAGGNVSVSGLRGRGKDVLMANVMCRRKYPYVSNIDYGGPFLTYFKLKDFDVGGNTFKEFLSGEVLYYEFPFPDGTDVCLSDAGVYLPSQYNAYLDSKYGYFASFLALSRQLGLSNFFHNSQAPERVWVKVREQSDLFIRCNWCIFPFARTRIPWLRDLVIQKITIYSKFQSMADNVPPYRAPRVRLNSDRKFNNYLEKQRYTIQYGDIKAHILVFRNKSKFDTRFFRTLLLNGKKPETEETAEMPSAAIS